MSGQKAEKRDRVIIVVCENVFRPPETAWNDTRLRKSNRPLAKVRRESIRQTVCRIRRPPRPKVLPPPLPKQVEAKAPECVNPQFYVVVRRDARWEIALIQAVDFADMDAILLGTAHDRGWMPVTTECEAFVLCRSTINPAALRQLVLDNSEQLNKSFRVRNIQMLIRASTIREDNPLSD